MVTVLTGFRGLDLGFSGVLEGLWRDLFGLVGGFFKDYRVFGFWSPGPSLNPT